jgi:hypothetical protein
MTEFIHEGKYAAEVVVQFNYSEDWAPTMSAEDERKPEAVRLALRRGDIAEACKYRRVFELKVVAGE